MTACWEVAVTHQSCTRHSCHHSSCPSLHLSLHAGSHTFSPALQHPRLAAPAACRLAGGMRTLLLRSHLESQ